MALQNRDPIFEMVVVVALVDEAYDLVHLVDPFVDTNHIVDVVRGTTRTRCEKGRHKTSGEKAGKVDEGKG